MRMPQKDNILQELNALNSQLAALDAGNIYSVPAGYFENLAVLVLNRIKALEATIATDELAYLSPALSRLSKEMPYDVPAGYFEGLTEKFLQSPGKIMDQDQAISQTAKEEIESISPLLGNLKKQMPYSIPEGYFDTVVKTPPANRKNGEGRLVSFPARKWFRYATAAMVVGLIAVTGLLYFANRKASGRGPLVKVEREVKKMNETQKENLIEFIDAGLNGKEMAKVNTDAKSKELRDLLKDIPEEELKDFQEQTEDIQDILMTN